MILSLLFIPNAVKENILKMFKNEAPAKYEKVYIKLHKGNPGEAGAAEAAGETTRKQVTLAGTTVLKNSAAVKWENVNTAETYKFISFWSAAEGGTFLGYAELTENKTVAIGDNAEFAAESFEWKVA